MTAVETPLWPPQQFGIDQALEALRTSRVVRKAVTLPTGGGKTRMIATILRLAGFRQILFTGRKILLEQAARSLEAAGIKFGIRAAGYDPDFDQPIQLAMIQTEHGRRGRWPRHPCDIVHVDEAHSHTGRQMHDLLETYRDSAWFGWTATPLGLGELYSDGLIVAGRMSDLRACGAVVPAYHYGPDEPDIPNIKRTKTGEFKQGDIVKAIMTQTIFGRVIDHWRKLNPLEKPTILFAPGVPESLWFAEQCFLHGIRSAHVDGDNIWLDGNTYESDHQAREEVARLSEAGEIKIVCNRFVLREGVDWPWIEHGIFATIFGSLTGYIQSGGRVLRQYYKELRGVRTAMLQRVTIQDHGGNWWRHGSLNSDRDWALGDDDYKVCELREELLRRKKEPEPICCPVCHMIRISGSECPGCGHHHQQRSRMVVQANGNLREMVGDILKPRRQYKKPDAEAKWEKCYFRALKADMTFGQARGLFAYENNFQWPAHDLPFMPVHEADIFSKVKDVPKSRLHGRGY